MTDDPPRARAGLLPPDKDSPTYSDVAAELIREARKRRGWKPADLAARCAEIGYPALTENIIENIESGRRREGRRRRDVTIDELAVISQALGIPPAALFPTLNQGPADMDMALFSGIDDVIARLGETKEVIKQRFSRVTEIGSGDDS